VYTVIEHPTFQRQAAAIWTDAEREAFIDWIAAHPHAGDVVPGSGGARKVRWARSGMGKRGGVRVVFFFLSKDGTILLLSIYVKGERENMTASEIIHRR
jgi:hypothetical protein